MSSRLFHSWTKGDRRNAAEALRSGGVVPIPVECITIKGMDYRAKSKRSRRPSPLMLDPCTENSSKHSSRTTESIALQSAAVQSATSLIAAMNDMLRSPPMSAHLSVQHQPGGLTPMHGRPRSHTAPSTPLVEAPFTEAVELPGSSIDSKAYMEPLHHSNDAAGVEPDSRPEAPLSLGMATVGPHSSPQGSSSGLQRLPTRASASTDSLYPVRSTPSARSSSPPRLTKTVFADDPPPTAEDTLIGSVDDSVLRSMKRPSLSVLQQWPSKPATTSEPRNSPKALPRRDSRPAASDNDTVPANVSQPNLAPPRTAEANNDQEVALMEQIFLMHATHDAHLSSLREAHGKEVETYRSYISFLEKRCLANTVVPSTSKQHLTIDTSHQAAKLSELSSANNSATTLQSWESGLDGQKRTSQDSSVETEALKRKLSLCRKAVAEAGDVRQERDTLRELADRGDRRILQLKDIVRKAKDHEKTLTSTLKDVDARLEVANMERTDVLEGYYEACKEMKKLARGGAAMELELKNLRSHRFGTHSYDVSDTKLGFPNPIATIRRKHLRAASDSRGVVAGFDPLLRQIQELNRQLADRDATIVRLEQRMERASSITERKAEISATSAALSRIQQLERALEEQRKTLVLSEADCERHKSVLHTELRRQGRLATQSALCSADRTAKPGDDVQRTAKPTQEAEKPLDVSKLDLQAELKHFLNEIVLYKLDIRGYKKDLKKAQAQIELLQTGRINAPPTPGRVSSDSTRSRATSENTGEHHRIEHDTASALGITLPQLPGTPGRSTVSSATSQADTPSLLPSATTASSRRGSKTALGSHKQLPNPPPSSRTPSPLLGHKTKTLQRAETLRSLSESIISSYAHREGTATEVHIMNATPPRIIRSRSSGLTKGVGCIAECETTHAERGTG